MAIRTRDEGFTILELMVVVLIIGVLLGIAVPAFGAATATSAKKSCFANQRTLASQTEAYFAEQGAYPSAGQATLVAADYLKRATVCPATGTDTYSISATSGVVTSVCLHGTFN